MSERYDLLIVGGGVSGTALLYTAARFSTLKRVALVEKYPKLAQVNSHGRHNSQTLHCGDIETNYSLEKALHVKEAADMIVNYAVRQDNVAELVRRLPKMVLGVGERETALLRDRYERFSPHYPRMKLLEAKDIARIEPNVAMLKGAPRPEPIVALGEENEYTACDFSALAQSFARSAQAVKGKTIDLYLGYKVTQIEQRNDGFHVRAGDKTLEATTIVVSSGGHSLLLAQQMGFGLDYSALPVGGSFYFTPKVLNGKVYTVQNDKLPFAAIHGDPDLLIDDCTRFGPTAVMLPMLERYHYGSIPEYLRVMKFDRDFLAVFGGLLKEREIRNYMVKNMFFEVPLLRRFLFLKDARKIVPSLKLSDVRYAHGFGGLRPQLVDKKARQLRLGEAKIDPDIGIIFNMTPSPGATSCLQNAVTDLRTVCARLNAEIDFDLLDKELVAPHALDKPSAASSGKTNVQSREIVVGELQESASAI